MPRKPRWWYVLQDSKNEVRLAVDLYNRSGVERQLEAFIVHMSMGWLKLLQAHFEQNGLDIYIAMSEVGGSGTLMVDTSTVVCTIWSRSTSL